MPSEILENIFLDCAFSLANFRLIILHMPPNWIKLFCGFLFRSALSEYEVDIQDGNAVLSMQKIYIQLVYQNHALTLGIDGVTSGSMTPLQIATKSRLGIKRNKTLRCSYF